MISRYGPLVHAVPTGPLDWACWRCGRGPDGSRPGCTRSRAGRLACLACYRASKDRRQSQHPLGRSRHPGWIRRVDDDEIEQDPVAPGPMSAGPRPPGFAIIDLRDLNNVKLLTPGHREPGAPQGTSARSDGKYFKLKGRYYYVQIFQFSQGTPDADSARSWPT